MTDQSTGTGVTQPSWHGARRHAVWAGLALTLVLSRAGTPMAFPLVDQGNSGIVPQGTELAPSDAQDLKHQLQIVNGLATPADGGWTFVPRIDVQELLTDNVLQQHSPRHWDLVSYVSPGFSLTGDLPRLSLNVNYAPTLAVYARETSLDALTHQLNGIGLVTFVPDLAFLDIRTVAGVHNANGGLGGQGGIGAIDAATAQSAIPSLGGNAQGLNRNNQVQAASISLSPFVLGHFGDWGVGKLGYSLNVTRSDSLSGFLAAPFPTGGSFGQTLLSHEANAHFVSGDILSQIQDVFDADMLQSQSTADGGSASGFTGLASTGPTRATSRRAVFSDQVTYKLTHSIALFASAGHEDIVYSGFSDQAIHGLTWSLGTTLTPNPDSRLTVSYGHQNGFNSIAADGYYGLTARTLLTLSYGSTLGTQLENLRNQLNLAAVGNNGTLVNGLNRGPLFGGTNALAVRNGVFRTDTLALGSQTSLDRDIVTFNLTFTKQTSAGGTVSSSVSAKTFGATWIHQMQPDMTLNGALSLSFQDQHVALANTSGNSTSVVASLGWQYEISDTVSLYLRYSFFDRQASVSALDFYQSMLILGASKTF